MSEIDSNAPIFNLAKFPNICRLCLQAKSPEVMLSTQNIKDENGFTLIELLDELTFDVPDHLKNHLPHSICTICYQIFEFVVKYKQKINTLLKFMVAVVEVKMGQNDSLVELFRTDNEYLSTIFKELDICHRDELDAEELIQDLERQEAEDLMKGLNREEADVEVKIEIGEHEYTRVDEMHLAQLHTINPLEEYVYEKPPVSSLTEFLEISTFSSRKTPAKKLPTKKLPAKKVDNNKYEFVSAERFDEGMTDNSNDNMDVADNGDNDVPEQEEGVEVKKEKPKRVRKHVTKGKWKRGKVKSDHILKCKACKFQTSYTDTYESHMERHNDTVTKYSCDFDKCGLAELTWNEMLEHKEQHSRYVCYVCGFVLKHKKTLDIHLRRHFGDKRYSCEYCKRDFYAPNELNAHITANHKADQDFQCSQCGLSYKSKKQLKDHEKRHTALRNFQCSMCALAFKSNTHLKRHENGVHKAIKFVCEHCNMSYGRQDKLRMHMEKAHNIQTYFNCNVCLKSFVTGEKLAEHRIQHDNPAEKQCGRCLAACLTKADFENHLCITYRDDYVCCDRDFKYHLYYNKHMFLAHGLKTNVRVKPLENVLTGCARAARKQVERCPKCEQGFPNRRLKKEHVETCGIEVEEEYII